MERQYLVTERAHFMCPNMHFGMLVELAAEYDGNKIKETLEKMAKAHPFLRSVISYDEDGVRLYYDVKDSFWKLRRNLRNVTFRIGSLSTWRKP